MSNDPLKRLPREGAGPGPEGEWLKEAVGYLAAALAPLLAMALLLDLWRADLRVPLFDGGDNLMGQMFVFNVVETGWFSSSGRLGAPGVQDLRDYPMADF